MNLQNYTNEFEFIEASLCKKGTFVEETEQLAPAAVQESQQMNQITKKVEKNRQNRSSINRIIKHHHHFPVREQRNNEDNEQDFILTCPSFRVFSSTKQ
jgi:hypothetical protein